MKNQILAIIICAVMRYAFCTSLLIVSKPCVDGLDYITNILIFIAACFYTTKIKLCPDLKSHLLLAIIETAVGIAMIEFMMGLWCSVENVILKIVRCGLVDDVEMAAAEALADMIIMGLAACVLLTVLIDGNLVQKAMAYYKSKRGPSKCDPRACNIGPRHRAKSPTPIRVRNPNCPCHGDNIMSCAQ